jgi:hypothetical protein
VTIPTFPANTYDAPQAESVLQGLGFVIGPVYGASGGVVFSTFPAEGSSEPYGSTVSIYIQPAT